MKLFYVLPKSLQRFNSIQDVGQTAFPIWFFHRRGRKYIPFYDKKTKSKKSVKDVGMEEKEIDYVKNIQGEEGNKELDLHEKFGKEIMPCVSPYQGLKLLFSFKKNPLISDEEKKENKINCNLIIRIDIGRESLRGMCSLKHSVDKNKKILVLVDEHENKHLKKYGADYVGLEYINKIKNGWLDFHICITDFKNINKILPIAKILGPRKLMPNIKSETLVENLEETIKKIKSGNSIEYRSESVDAKTFELLSQVYMWKTQTLDTHSIAHINVPIATCEMNFYHILDNMKSFVSEIVKSNVHSTQVEKTKTNSFVWPPITSKEKKKKLLQMQYYKKGIYGSRASSDMYTGTTDESHSFLLGAYITYEQMPKIFLKASQLTSNSTGYII